MPDINHKGLCYIIVIFLMISCTEQNSDSSNTHIIEIEQMSFIPETLSISPDDSVKWINKDLVTHDVESNNPEKWKSPKLEQRESFTVEVTSKAKYKCTLHPVMKGVILLRSQP